MARQDGRRRQEGAQRNVVASQDADARRADRAVPLRRRGERPAGSDEPRNGGAEGGHELLLIVGQSLSAVVSSLRRSCRASRQPPRGVIVMTHESKRVSGSPPVLSQTRMSPETMMLGVFPLSVASVKQPGLPVVHCRCWGSLAMSTTVSSLDRISFFKPPPRKIRSALPETASYMRSCHPRYHRSEK
jgi:hypothetical protein